MRTQDEVAQATAQGVKKPLISVMHRRKRRGSGLSGGDIDEAALAQTGGAGFADTVDVKRAGTLLRVSLGMADSKHRAQAIGPGHGVLAVSVRRGKGLCHEHGRILTNG